MTAAQKTATLNFLVPHQAVKAFSGVRGRVLNAASKSVRQVSLVEAQAQIRRFSIPSEKK